MTKENHTHLHVAIDGFITCRVLVKFIIGILLLCPEHRMQKTNMKGFVVVVT